VLNKQQLKAGFTCLLFTFLILAGCKQDGKKSEKADQKLLTPDKVYGELFDAVQMQQVFADSKTFPDCLPRRSPAKILKDYKKLKGPGLDLKKFVADNFLLPESLPVISTFPQRDIKDHIEQLWPLLLRKPDSVNPGSSLLPLPFPYLVPGGRFREVYYWDSYFTMLGLKVSGRLDIMENMVNNFAYLIKTYGYIPNGNRTYYLSRSQPPFFSMMVDLLATAKKDPGVYLTYLEVMEKEYLYWMLGDKGIKPGENSKKVHLTKEGYFLNRYLDTRNDPRPESYREDFTLASASVEKQMATMRFASQASADSFARKRRGVIYRHLRSGAESGWDFSSRWLVKSNNPASIQTSRIAPVDLNCLLYFTEKLLGEQFSVAGDTLKANAYARWAVERSDAIFKYFFNEELGFFTDYHIGNKKPTARITAAGLFPLYFLDSNLLAGKMAGIEKLVRNELLAPGGLLTTNLVSGEQWDAPNGWAPLQWMAIIGLERCGKHELARDIALRWMKLNTDVYERTGKLMEKYNVVDTKLDAGGGEYPGQDGFGWTNGVLLALFEKFGVTPHNSENKKQAPKKPI
jgi:alpha,alpha-trehalase